MPPSPPAKPKPRFARETAEVRRASLIAAAWRTLAKHGIAGFTIDTICTEAGVSRGLINHHFNSKDDLLVAVYQTSLQDSFPAHLGPETDGLPPTDRLRLLIDRNFTQSFASPDTLRVWLALWGEIATNPALKTVHRTLYDRYRAALNAEITAIATARNRPTDAPALSRTLIALVDGLWLEWCLAPEILSTDQARTACLRLIEHEIGPL